MNVDQIAQGVLKGLEQAARLVLAARDNAGQKVKALETIKEAIDQFVWVMGSGSPDTAKAFHTANTQVDASLYETKKRAGLEIVPAMVSVGRDCRTTQRGNIQTGARTGGIARHYR